MIPWGDTDEVLDDLSLDINPGRDFLGILALQVGQQPLEVEVHGVLAGLGLNRLLIGHDELVQTVHHLIEHVRGNDTVAQQFFFPLCPRRCHLFASTNWHADIGRLLEAIDITIRYAMQQGSKAGIQ